MSSFIATPDSRLRVVEITLQTGILDRDRRLQGEQLSTAIRFGVKPLATDSGPCDSLIFACCWRPTRSRPSGTRDSGVGAGLEAIEEMATEMRSKNL
jgi:hypothetical protein